MKRICFLLFLLGFIHHGQSQIGINTESPSALFHIHSNTGTANVNDVVITGIGDVGIGTTIPSNKLSIVTTGGNTGLHLPNGALPGYNLKSDALGQGNASWSIGRAQFQTSVYGNGDTMIATSIFPNFVKIGTFTGVLFDTVKSIYGLSYGWNITNQHYVVPIDGIYRISMQVYFFSNYNISRRENYRAYIFRNGVQFLDPGIISVTDTGYNDIAAYVMGLAELKKGDILDLRLAGQPSGALAYNAQLGDTFLIIEAL